MMNQVLRIYQSVTSNGCDSIIFLNLTINNSNQSAQIVTTCDSYLWNDNIYTESGTYEYQTQTSNGCDSTVTLILTVNNSSESTKILQHVIAIYEW